MAPLQLNKDNFETTVESSDILFVDYWAEWCGPCRAFSPVFEQAADEHPEITFAKVNTEKEQELAAAMQIRSIPNLMVFRDGLLLYNQPGMLPAPALEELISKVKELDMEDVRKAIADSKAEQSN